MSALCYINPARRVSTGVVQLICNQKVGGSNPSPGTSVPLSPKRHIQITDQIRRVFKPD
jgi:hypothetical protein